jgi:hypothetical protein
MTVISGKTVELGGEAASSLLDPAGTVAMHTTCYEHVTKVLGLKATNAFWNPKYYDPRTPTITKQIIFINELQVLDEIRSLVWLAMASNSTLIIPNLLGSKEGSQYQHQQAMDIYRDQLLWPAYRVAYFKRLEGQSVVKVKVAEPGFYWRIERDYSDPPDPVIIFFDPKASLSEVKEKIDAVRMKNGSSRIVLHSSHAYPLTLQRRTVLSQQSQFKNLERYHDVDQENEETRKRVSDWAKDSVGVYSDTFTVELQR